MSVYLGYSPPLYSDSTYVPLIYISPTSFPPNPPTLVSLCVFVVLYSIFSFLGRCPPLPLFLTSYLTSVVILTETHIENIKYLSFWIWVTLLWMIISNPSYLPEDFIIFLNI